MKDLDYFFRDTVSLVTICKGTLVHGVYKEGTHRKKKDIACCVQPVGREELNKEYGYYIDAQYRVFCYVDADIKEGSVIRYNGVEYKVNKLVDWFKYYILLIGVITNE